MQTRRHPLLPRSLGTLREIVSFHYGEAGRGEKVYLQSGLHADEPPGALVLFHLRRLLADAEAHGEVQGEVVVVPLCNPIGLSQTLLHEPLGRFDLGTGENFNRRYPDLARLVEDEVRPRLTGDPDDNRRAIRAAVGRALGRLPIGSEIDSLRHTLLLLAHDADVVLDLHCDTEAVLHVYADEPCWPQAEPLCRFLGARTILLSRGSGGAAFDETLSGIWWQLDEGLGSDQRVPLGCFAATVELRGKADVSHELALLDAQRLLGYLRHRGVLLGPEAPPPPLLCEPTPLAGSETLRAPIAGVLAFRKGLDQLVEAGQTVVEVVDPITDEVAQVRAGVSGRLYAREDRRFATRGMELCKVAGKVAFRTGPLLGD